MDCVVHGVAKSRTRLSNFHFQFYTSLIGQEKERRHLFLSGDIQSESFIPERHPNTSFFFWPTSRKSLSFVQDTLEPWRPVLISWQ